MSAGAGENVMGVLADSSGAPRSGNSDSRNSGFNGTLENGSKYSSGIAFPEAKYYDLYKSDILATSYYSGDAIYETNGWYRDKGVYFVTETYPWLSRGGWYTGGYDKGIFMFYRATGYGNGSDFHSARCVMKS